MRISEYFVGVRSGRLAATALTITALTLMTSAAAMATQRYVQNPGGSDITGGNCSNAAAPCQTIQNAINQSSPGDTINVAAGVYPEKVSVNVANLTILGAQHGVNATTRSTTPAMESIMDNTTNASSPGATSFYVQASGTGADIDGFTVQNETSSNQFGYGILLAPGTSGTQILNNIIQNNIAGLGLAGNNVTISQNLFKTNNQSGPATGTGIYTDQYTGGGPISNVTISGNSFTGNNTAGIGFSDTDTANPDTNVTISNNTFTSNNDGMYIFDLQSSSITNNTISSSTNEAIDLDGADSGLTISNNTLSTGVEGIRIINFIGTAAADANSNVTIHQNNITSFTTAGLFVDTAADDSSTGGVQPAYSGGSVPATCDWWGSASGPMNSGNPGGTGSAVHGPATFIPWLIGTVGSPGGVCSGGLPPSSIPSSGVCNGTYNRPFNGNVTVPSGDTCTLVGSSVGGNITVQGTGTLTCVNEAVYGTISLTGNGGTLSFTGGSIDSQGNNFSVIATNPQAVSLYNTSTNYTVEVNGSGGSSPQGVDIEGTTIGGSVVTNTAYSVLLVNNSVVDQNAEFLKTTNVPSHFTTSMRNTLCNITIGGVLEVENNTAPFGIGAGNGCSAPPSSGSVHVDGAAIVTGNVVTTPPPPPTPSGGSVTIDMNYIGGSLSCSGNTPPPSESAPKNNTVGGGATGQCAGFAK